MCDKRHTPCTYTAIDKRSLKGERLAKLREKKTPEEGSNIILNSKIEEASNSTYIPKSLQPLLSFPLEDKRSLNHAGKIFDGILPIVLLSPFGDFKYFGETCPISLLSKCKEIYTKKIGSNIFSDEKRLLFDERPVMLDENFQPVELPTRIEMEELLYYFKFNINDIYYVFDFHDFCNTVVDNVYHDFEETNTRNLVLVYLVGSLGLIYKAFSKGAEYKTEAALLFKLALMLLQHIPEDGGVWMVQLYFLIHFYYQADSNRTTSWINLGRAIRYAQSLGMHTKHINSKVCRNKKEKENRENLFRSLYICDRISSVFLGRPLGINAYDDATEEIPKDFNMRCQLELSNLSQIIGRIMELYYNEKSIDINASKKLAIDLKKWTTGLDKELKVDNIIQWKIYHADTLQSQHNNYILLLVHLLQLYGIMILSHPFVIFQVMNPNVIRGNETSEYAKLTYDLYIAGVKSSILTIKLINFFINSNRRRCDLYIIMCCCAFATFMIGIKLIHGDQPDEPFSSSELMECLDMSMHILSFYVPFNYNAKSLLEEARVMKTVLQNRTLNPNVDEITLNFSNDVNFIEDQTYNLETLKGFQQYFV